MPHIGFGNITLFNKRTQRLIGPGASQGGLLLDAVIQEEIGHEATKTAFPIELGAEINDHLIQRPGLYSMRGVVSDRPLLWFHTDYQHADAATRSLSAYAILRDLWNERETFDILTGFLTIENAVLVSFKAEKTARTANMFNFEARIDEMVIVQTSEAQIQSSSVAPDAEGAVPPSAGGKKVAQPVPDNRSALLTGVESVAGPL
ncbi:MAG: hypothetical protein V3V08_05450 [Nannocystaceae bacterium]